MKRTLYENEIVNISAYNRNGNNDNKSREIFCTIENLKDNANYETMINLYVVHFRFLNLLITCMVILVTLVS